MLTILHFDDDEWYAAGIATSLRHAGCTVIWREHPTDDPVAVVAGLKPDCILMDITMPVMNGLDAGQLLKKNPATAKVPLIFLTTLDVPSYRAEARQMGAADYLVKTAVTVGDVVQAIHKSTDHPRTHS